MVLETVQDCNPQHYPHTEIAAIIQVESGGNPYAIGVVNGRLERQPNTLEEAIATAQYLQDNGWNYSVGIAQINKTNFSRYQLNDLRDAFDTCKNIEVSAKILNACKQQALFTNVSGSINQAVYSCYYSGNFSRGFQKEGNVGGTSYVERVLTALESTPKSESQQTASQAPPIRVIPGNPSARPTNSGRHIQRVSPVNIPSDSNEEKTVPGSDIKGTNNQQSTIVF